MPYNNSYQGSIDSALLRSPYVQWYEEFIPFPPPSAFFLIDDSGDYLLDDSGDKLLA